MQPSNVDSYCYCTGYDLPYGRGMSSGNDSVVMGYRAPALKIRNGIIDRTF